MKQRFGTGDGANVIFMGSLRGPIVPGSLDVRVLPEDAVSQLAALDDFSRFEAICTDALFQDGVLVGDGSLIGDVRNESKIDYETSLLKIEWFTAPNPGQPIIATWQRRLHRLHDAKVQVRLPPHGAVEWVSLADLNAALGNL